MISQVFHFKRNYYCLYNMQLNINDSLVILFVHFFQEGIKQLQWHDYIYDTQLSQHCRQRAVDKRQKRTRPKYYEIGFLYNKF